MTYTLQHRSLQSQSNSVRGDQSLCSSVKSGYYLILTPRQNQILRLWRTGLTTSEIATSLVIAPTTVKWHLKAIRKHFPGMRHGGAPNRPSPREAEVLSLLSQGKAVPVIGRHLGVAPVTVKTYIRRLYNKLSANNRVDLALTQWVVDGNVEIGTPMKGTR